MALAAPPRPEVLVRGAWIPTDLKEKLDAYDPQTDVGRRFKDVMFAPGLTPEMRYDLLEVVSRIIVMQSQLEVRVFRGLDGTPWLHPGDEGWDLRKWPEYRLRGSYHPLLDPRDPLLRRLVEEYGTTSRRVITNSGVDYLIADLAGAAGSQDISLFKFHGVGTDATAEAATQSALIAELTTEYNPNSTRATGSQTVNTGPTPDTYSTQATNTLDSGTPTIQEHGLFTASSAGTMLDRSLTGGQALVGANGDGIQTTYTATVNAGG